MNEYVFKNTVFILGAGASKPYSFPIGKELKQQIIDLIDFHPDVCQSPLNKNDDQFFKNLKEEGYGYEEVSELGNHLRITGAKSIDHLLQDHDVNSRLLVLAKMIIYYLISQQEIFRNLKREDWIEPFVHYSMGEHRDEFLKYPPVILSFNYDNLYKKKVEYILQNQYRVQNYIYPKPKINHIYGRTLGANFDRTLEEVGRVEYFDEIKEQASLLSLMRGERDEVAKNYEKILNECEKIIILGYGFDKNNNYLLFKDIKKIREYAKSGKIFATGYDFKDEAINSLFGSSSGETSWPMKSGEKCSDLINRLIPESFF